MKALAEYDYVIAGGGAARCYDLWRDAGRVGWGYDDVLPYFKKAETNVRGAKPVHGGTGPLRVSWGVATTPICDLLLEAAGQSRFPVVDDSTTLGPKPSGISIRGCIGAGAAAHPAPI